MNIGDGSGRFLIFSLHLIESMGSSHKKFSFKRKQVVLLLLFLIVGSLVFVEFFTGIRWQKESEDALYKDATRSTQERVDDLLSRMTTDEKIGQMALVEQNSILLRSDIARFGLGALLSGGGGGPDENTQEGWLTMVNDFQERAKSSRLGIPLLYGVDAVHGHSNVFGATIFPHQIGLGASADADLVRRIAVITAEEMITTGTNWNFSPTADVVQDIRWGRTYETFGADTKLVEDLTTAYVEGLHSLSIVGTAKHYLGSGAMEWGTSTNPGYQIDQGVITIDEAVLRSTHLPPFARAIDAGVGSIMVSHASWNDVELTTSHMWLTDILKGELSFQGFVVSDWYSVFDIPGDKYDALVTAVNAGVDMVMLPYEYRLFATHMRRAVDEGDISMDRLNDAVQRILRIKFEAGLFDNQTISDADIRTFGSIEHKEVAREAVRKSLVLLKDAQQILPISKETPRILVAGDSADNLGRQAGGWTIEWQGIDGNWIPGTTILQGIEDAVSSETNVEYRQAGDFPLGTELADVGIVIVGETPYAEGVGDNEHPELSAEDLEVIDRVRAISKTIIVILVSGRPLDVSPYVNDWDALVTVWLPGSEGGGVADVLFGDYPFTGKLPLEWPL